MDLHTLVNKARGFDGWSHPEKIKLFAWYLLDHKGRARFSPADIRQCYGELHLQKPSNVSPFIKSLEDRKPPVLLRDGQGFYLEKRARDGLTRIYGDVAAMAPVSKLLDALPGRVPDPAERGFVQEAITCIRYSACRAAIVLGWCAAIHHIRRKIEALGFDKFNAASVRLKNQNTGKFKRWNKEFSIQTMSELQTVFDTDLITVVDGMGLIDGNQSQRLETCFEYRCHSAHPGDAPISEAHVVAFFTDIVEIVLTNPRFAATQQA